MRKFSLPSWYTLCTRERKFVVSILFFLSLTFFNNVNAQTQTVTGSVKEENGEGMQGVNIIEKGSSKGVISDVNGFFSIKLNGSSGTLVVSYAGYISQELTASAGNSLEIVLKRATGALNEVVVIGYGSQRKRDVTGAVSTIDLSANKDVPSSNVGRLLVAQAPGVTVKQNTGQPGREFEITIRGQGSLGAGSQPLYVVDGFPIGTSLGQNINGDDLENISILKDAVSTAIYGARGSNGVVLITTKTAKANQSYTNVSGSFGIQNIPDGRRTKMMTGPQFAQFKKERFMDAIRYYENREPSEDEVPEDFRHPEQTRYSTDWFDQIMHNNAPFQNYNVTVANGNGKFRSLFSASYNRQDGALKYTNFDRFSIRENLESKVTDFITVGWKLNGTYARNRLAPGTEGRDNTVGISLDADPRDPAYREDGSINPYIGNHDGVFGYPNPLLMLQDIKTTQETGQILSNAYAEVNFLRHFKFKTAFNTFINYTTFKQFTPSTIGGKYGGPPPQDASEYDQVSHVLNYAADQLLTYNNDFGKHRINVLAGFTAQQETGKSLNGSGNQYPNDLVPYLGSAALKSAGSSEYGWTTAAWFARLNYVFNEKYLLSATFRREGSSRFGEDNKYGNFPAFSAGWRVFDEKFFPKNGVISDLKLRGSWGITGNNAIGNYPSLAFLNENDYIIGGGLARGLTITSLPNPDLKWEKARTVDLGIDLSAFNNKLTFTAEVYDKVTSDMLLPVQVPAISGFTSYFTNIGKVRNKGLEFLAGYKTKFNEVGFHVGGNISFNRSRVLEISNDQHQLLTGGFYEAYNISKEGQPLGLLFGYRVLGIFQNQDEIDHSPAQPGAIPGVFKMYDGDGDGTISYDTKDMVVIGNPEPKGRYGINIGADYKGFDLGVLVNGAYGYQLYRTIEESTLNMDGVFNVLQMAVNRYRSPSMPNVGKRMIPTTNTWQWERESNSSYIYDADHIWIKNVTLGYTFKKLKAPFTSIRVYANVDNFLLFSKYPGSNPDVNAYGGLSSGSDDESYPLPRTFSFGVNVNL